MKKLILSIVVVLTSLPMLTFAQKTVNKKLPAKQIEETKSPEAAVTSSAQDYSMDDMQKQWMDMMSPKEEHKKLAEGEGVYSYEGNQWIMPGAEPMSVEGKTTAKMIMEGRFLEETSKGNFGGFEFQGRGTTGYDNITHEYVMTWIDNMSTASSTFRGQMKENVLTLFSKQRDPMTGKFQTHKIVVTYKEDGAQMMEYFILGERNSSFKSMELHYTKLD